MLLDVIRRWRDHLIQAGIEEIEAKVRVRRGDRKARRAAAGRAMTRLQLYQQRVAKVTGIAGLTIVCPTDTLRHIEGIGAVRRARWTPLNRDRIDELPGDMVRARLSTSQVTYLLFAFAGISRAIPTTGWGNNVDPAMCERLYDLFGAAIDPVDLAAGDTPTLIINADISNTSFRVAQMSR